MKKSLMPSLTSDSESVEQQKALSVSQLNRLIRQTLEERFLHIWVEAEISNFKHHTSGHMYLTLKDESSQINAVFFSRSNRGLKFQLKNGLKVLVRGRISVYEPRGQYQVYIEQVIPKGLGELQLALMQLKEKLQNEGLFDPSLKKPIPKFPKGFTGSLTSPVIECLVALY